MFPGVKVPERELARVLFRGVKTIFNKTGNRFVETGYLLVIILRDVMCHMAVVLERKAAGEVKRNCIITTSTVCVK